MATETSRRTFLKTASVGATAMAMSAASYGRVVGANDRLSIAQIGCGDRGRGAHMVGVNRYTKDQNLEITAVCDPWRIAREKAVKMTKDWYGREARQFVSYREVMALEDVDAVMIASCDHQHTTHMKAAAQAKKHIYGEKPLAMDWDKFKDTWDTIKESGVVFQAGTQLRSYASFTGAKALYATGALGRVGRVEQHRNSDRPYWYSRIKEVKEEDVDWKEFLMDRPMRPFDSVQYSGWYGYRDFTDGPIPGLATHYIDLVHYITGATLPISCVALGGTYTWIDEHKFDAPDHATTEWVYPEGFLVSYSTNFGNGSGSTFKIFGNEAVMDLQNWNAPTISEAGVRKPAGKYKGDVPIEPVECPDHVLNWVECIRKGGTPNAGLEPAYQQTLAVLMSMRAFDSGKRQTYDPDTRAILEG